MSGPGRLSQRTDGSPGGKLAVAPGLAYGERQQTLAQERTAPMAVTDKVPDLNIPQAPSQPPTATTATAQGAQQFAFTQSSNRPNEPVTHGVDIGPGGGPEVLPQAANPTYQSMGPMSQMLSNLSATDRSGVLAQLYSSARASGV